MSNHVKFWTFVACVVGFAVGVVYTTLHVQEFAYSYFEVKESH